jgi:hypothetical protein
MNKEKRDLTVFGYGLGIISVIFGTGSILKHGANPAGVVLLICCVVFVSVTALHWQALRPGYAGWMKVAHFIGGIVTTVILTAVFFLVFTPVALVIKLAGKDHLDRKIDSATPSYWHKRPAFDGNMERYKQQF